MKFCTAITCMDGRIQIPVIRYLQARFAAGYVDVVAEPGINRVLATGTDTAMLASIWRRVEISTGAHASVGMAVVGHHDCAGNPAAAEVQNGQTLAAAARIRKAWPKLPVLALWVGPTWQVVEIEAG